MYNHLYVVGQAGFVRKSKICEAIKQNESEVEKYDFWIFDIFYYGIV